MLVYALVIGWESLCLIVYVSSGCVERYSICVCDASAWVRDYVCICVLTSIQKSGVYIFVYICVMGCRFCVWKCMGKGHIYVWVYGWLIFKNILFIYLLMRDTETERAAETQAEGEAGSIQGWATQASRKFTSSYEWNCPHSCELASKWGQFTLKAVKFSHSTSLLTHKQKQV